jgi:hypothetical protein
MPAPPPAPSRSEQDSSRPTAPRQQSFMLREHTVNGEQIEIQVDGAPKLARIKRIARFRELTAPVSAQGERQAGARRGARDLPSAVVAIAPARRLRARHCRAGRAEPASVATWPSPYQLPRQGAVSGMPVPTKDGWKEIQGRRTMSPIDVGWLAMLASFGAAALDRRAGRNARIPSGPPGYRNGHPHRPETRAPDSHGRMDRPNK